MRIYLSGAISNDPDYMEHFAEVERKIKKQGKDAVNPAHFSLALSDGGFSYEEYMRIDLELLKMCDAICMLHGWENSCGANREFGYALARDIIILTEDEMTE